MKKLLWLLPVIGVLLLLTQSCSDNSVNNQNSDVEERKQEVQAITETILPSDLSQALINEADNLSESDKIVYLDSVEVVIRSLKDSTEKYSNVESFKQEIRRFQDEIEKQTAKNKGGLVCSNDFRFGYAKSGELNGATGLNAAIGAIEVGLNVTGGGGIDIIYDFVNMDRGFYPYSFCGVKGALGGLGAGWTVSGGFTGISKFITNIPFDKDNIDRFNGASKSKNYRVSLGLSALLGFDLGLGVGKTQKIEDAEDRGGFFRNWAQCPANLNKPVNNRAPIEYSFNVSASISKGAELIAALEAEEVASYREAVNGLYTNFGRYGWGGRKFASAKMALNLATPYPVKGISTVLPTPFDVTAAAMAIGYGFMDPEDCPEPAYFPKVETLNATEVTQNSATLGGRVVDNGNSEIIEKGICWDVDENPDLEDNCSINPDDSSQFSESISGLTPNTTYFARAYATNNIGTAYGEVISITTMIGASGFLSGSVLDAVTRDPVSDVSLSIFSQQGTKVGEVFSQSSGDYSIEVPVGEGYNAEFTKSGYLSATYSNITVTEDEDYILTPLLYIDEQYSGTGNISGSIRNALSSEGVSGLNLSLRKGINNLSGEIIRQTSSGNNGKYIFSNIEAGYYTVTVTGQGYNDTDFNVISIGGKNTDEQNAVISPVLDESEIRIVLTWGEFPYDLDSHVTGPRSDGNRFHVAYFSDEYRENNQLVANLDRDDTSSYGPETITIYKTISGVYRYSVHDYTNLDNSSSNALSNSGAQVKVYFGNNLERTFNVPPNKVGTLWTVFELNDNQLKTVNSFSNISDPRNVNNTAGKQRFKQDEVIKL